MVSRSVRWSQVAGSHLSKAIFFQGGKQHIDLHSAPVCSDPALFHRITAHRKKFLIVLLSAIPKLKDKCSCPFGCSYTLSQAPETFQRAWARS